MRIGDASDLAELGSLKAKVLAVLPEGEDAAVRLGARVSLVLARADDGDDANLGREATAVLDRAFRLEVWVGVDGGALVSAGVLELTPTTVYQIEPVLGWKVEVRT
jgi:hypothetical protein